ncbi:M3 family oligoendopeptidase [Humisphaera borealis]|uniref:M3 family oligoendopeptidase n=1 Tax=Humisphaera borealis TaxID=2807512 RepID=A0A7M2WRU0_9BACT|nr:M3 family oligoendopeptidase [Humisphaera borealis]QOV88196.1 M3 family oligoendopeptidase [Humisphaera borealis]
MTAAAPATTSRTFVPADIDLADFDRIEPLYRILLDRPVETVAQLQSWLKDASELSAAIDEYGNRRYIDNSCHTDDPALEKAYLHYVENVDPKVKPLAFEMQKKFLASPALEQLRGDRWYAMLERKWKADVEVFRAENVPLETQVTKLTNEYDKISGEQMVTFKGKEYTPQQIARFYEQTDRPTRQGAWEAATSRRLQDAERIETIFDKQLPLRQTIAQNAGMRNYRDLAWKANKRFDYTPADCQRFADAIAATVVPLVAKLHADRAKDLGIDSVRPWDLEVDPQNRSPLHPFAENDVDGFVAKTREIFDRLSPDIAADFDQLKLHGNLDLASRKGKQPGGYQCSLEESKQPFIFMNAAGLHRDVETLLHEGGHAFHYQWACRKEPLVFLRSAPMEFCEVASMAMELLGGEHLDVFYDAEGQARAARKKLEGILRFFPWMATIDQFQHWIYTHQGHSREERAAHWLMLMDRFGKGVDWTGHELARRTLWQRQLHLFHAPFYYIEYGIAQLGALQLWMKAKEDPHRALANYRTALTLGGTRTLPDLFAAAGIRFDFSEKTLAPLVRAIEEELAGLPA